MPAGSATADRPAPAAPPPSASAPRPRSPAWSSSRCGKWRLRATAGCPRCRHGPSGHGKRCGRGARPAPPRRGSGRCRYCPGGSRPAAASGHRRGRRPGRCRRPRASSKAASALAIAMPGMLRCRLWVPWSACCGSVWPGRAGAGASGACVGAGVRFAGTSLDAGRAGAKGTPLASGHTDPGVMAAAPGPANESGAPENRDAAGGETIRT